MRRINRILIGTDKNIVFLAVIHLLIAIVLYQLNNTLLLYVNLLLFWFETFSYSLNIKQNGVLFLGFLVSFFVFLLGRDFFLTLLGLVIDEDLSFFDTHTTSLIYLLMMCSLSAVTIGFRISQPNIKRPPAYDYSEGFLRKSKYICSKLFDWTIPFVLILHLIAAYNTIRFGYANVEDGFVQGGFFLKKMLQLNNLAFMGYLMLAPSKKELILKLKVLFIVYAISFLGGSRGTFLYLFCVVFLYLLSHDYLVKNGSLDDEIIITQKIKKYLIILSIPLFVFLNFVSVVRAKNSFEFNGVSQDVAGFFIQVGGSYNVIGFTIANKNVLPPNNISYSFGPLINLLKHGTISRLIGVGTPDPSHDEQPFVGNNLDATLTYLETPTLYENGGGNGTQYIAEQYADFGITGVIVLSFFLGFVISKMTFFSTRGWIISTLLVLGAVNIISMPRDFFLTWLSSLISVFNIFVLILIYKASIRRKQV